LIHELQQNMNRGLADGRILLSILSVLVVCWGILGWMDLPFQSRAGFETNGYNIVTRVGAGSPAEAAGLEPGVRITHFDGIPVEDAATLARRSHKKVGERQLITAEHSGKSRDFRIAYGPISQHEISLSHAKTIVGFCFLLFPLIAVWRNNREATRLLTLMGIGLSLAFMTGPYAAEFSIRAFSLAVISLFVTLGVAALLHFLLVFPHRRLWLNRPFGKKLIYLPAFILWLLIAWRLLFTPAASSALSLLTNAMTGIITGVYLLFSLFLVLRNYSLTDRTQRRKLRLNRMLLGTVLAIVPVTIAQLVFAFSPHSGLPGQNYYFVTLALIPLTWACSAGLSPK